MDPASPIHRNRGKHRAHEDYLRPCKAKYVKQVPGISKIQQVTSCNLAPTLACDQLEPRRR